jgi:hypothetical protein
MKQKTAPFCMLLGAAIEVCVSSGIGRRPS